MIVHSKYVPTDVLAVLFLLVGTGLFTTIVSAQSVDELRDAYSGKLAWDPNNGTLRLTESGEVDFSTTGLRSFIWHVPSVVKEIRIARNVTFNGAFHSTADLSIVGEDRNTSVVYGTDERAWSQSREVKAFRFCTFQNFGGVMRITNLTSLNPRGFHVRGWGNVVHAVSCDFLDRRGGHHNNSDGFEGGDGSTVHDCYFESGDDIIKVYFEITVTDTTIKMIDNTVPIQLGWGNYSNGAVGTFRNLTVIGDGGRYSEGRAVISGRQGRYDVMVNIDGCRIANPNGTLVSLREDSMTLRGSITNAQIRLKAYAGEFQRGKNLLRTVGSTRRHFEAARCRAGQSTFARGEPYWATLCSILGSSILAEFSALFGAHFPDVGIS